MPKKCWPPPSPPPSPPPWMRRQAWLIRVDAVVMGSWCNGQLLVWAFIVILLLSSLWFIWNNSFCQILARDTSTASHIRNLPITPGLLYCIVTVYLRESDCNVTIIRSMHTTLLYLEVPEVAESGVLHCEGHVVQSVRDGWEVPRQVPAVPRLQQSIVRIAVLSHHTTGTYTNRISEI